MLAFPNHRQGLSPKQIGLQLLQQPLGKQATMNPNHLSLHFSHKNNQEYSY